jgi:hypothetical protein
MRHVHEVLRLRTAGISGNEIARRLNLAPSTVRLTLQRLATAGLSWPLPTELTDAALEVRITYTPGSPIARVFPPLVPVDEPQRHRHALSDLRDVYRPDFATERPNPRRQRVAIVFDEVV